MSKHPLDHGHDNKGERLERYTEIERGTKPNLASETLQKRAKDEPDSRLERYTEIERRKEE